MSYLHYLKWKCISQIGHIAISMFCANFALSLDRWTDGLFGFSPLHKTLRGLVYVQVGCKMALVAKLTPRRKSISREIFCKILQYVVISTIDTWSETESTRNPIVEIDRDVNLSLFLTPTILGNLYNLK